MKRSVLLGLALVPGPLAADDWLARIEREAAKVEPTIVELRHQVHQNPELSNREEKTARLVAQTDSVYLDRKLVWLTILLDIEALARS